MTKINISNFPEANFLVSDGYIDSLAEVAEVVAVDEPDYKIVGVVRPARRGRFLEVAGNPLLDWNNHRLSGKVIEELKTLGRQNNCVFVRVRPQIKDSEENRRIFKSLGFVRSPMHLLAENTLILDLTKTEEEMFSGMRKSSRYEIRQAEKLGVVVRQVEINDTTISKFIDMMVNTSQRQNYVMINKKEIYSEISNMNKAGIVRMYESLTKNGKDIAMALVVLFNKEADYLYGASTDLAREVPGAYAIQWQAIRDAKAAGCVRYNFWGIAPEGAKKNHRFAGVTTFKRGFGGEPVNYTPAHDLVLNRKHYAFSKVVELYRKKRRKL